VDVHEHENEDEYVGAEDEDEDVGAEDEDEGASGNLCNWTLASDLRGRTVARWIR
jgi:hypothetical protein